MEKENYYELLRSRKRIFSTNYHSFQNHYRIDQWKTFTSLPTKISAHSGLYTSHLACLRSLAVYILTLHTCDIRLLHFLNAFPYQST